VTAAVLIDLRRGGPSRLAARLRNEDGIGLIELLIALLVLNIGIFATFGAFTSAAVTLRRASHISTAAAIADQEMEALRNTAYANLPGTTLTIDPWPSSPDGRSYKVVVTPSSGAQTPTGSTAVKVMQVQVSDDGDSNKILVTSTSTFSHCNQAGLGTGADPNPCQS
jgi:Tfp pilus assembly protein PilE